MNNKNKLNLLNKIEILIYDKSEVLINLVKHYCGSSVEILYCNGIIEIDKLNLNEINTSFILADNKDDLVDIFLIYQISNRLYLSTKSEELKKKIEGMKGVNFFDIQKNKFEIMHQIFNDLIGV